MVPVKGRGPVKSAMTNSGLQTRESLHLNAYLISMRSLKLERSVQFNLLTLKTTRSRKCTLGKAQGAIRVASK
jgi:hypothetical protein